jgi:HSP20 family protein
MARNITRTEASDRVERNYPASPFRLFEDFFNDWAVRSMEGRQSEAWAPPVDVVEREGNLTLMLSLPGMNEKEIEIKVDGQVLTVKGERKLQESEGYTYHKTESRYGPFSRSFTLPESAELHNIKADYKNGILKIMIPPKPEVKLRTIKINI